MSVNWLLNWPFPNRRIDGPSRWHDARRLDSRQDAQQWEAPEYWNERPRLLIGISDDAVAAVCDQYFTEQGFAVETASCGLRCLQLLKTWSPHALILELELPWGGGDGVLECLREEPRWRNVPVLLLSETVSERRPPSLAHRVDALHASLGLPRFLDVLRDEIPDLAEMLANDGDD